MFKRARYLVGLSGLALFMSSALAIGAGAAAAGASSSPEAAAAAAALLPAAAPPQPPLPLLRPSAAAAVPTSTAALASRIIASTIAVDRSQVRASNMGLPKGKLASRAHRASSPLHGDAK